MKFVNACVGERAFAEATYCLSKFNLEETLEGKQCNCTLWSPAGSIVIFAALGDLASSGNMPIKGLLHKQWIKSEIPKENDAYSYIVLDFNLSSDHIDPSEVENPHAIAAAISAAERIGALTKRSNEMTTIPFDAEPNTLQPCTVIEFSASIVFSIA